MQTQEETESVRGQGGKRDPDSIRALMSDAWADHHHTREQSWKTVQYVVTLFAAMIALDFKNGDGNRRPLVLIAGISVCGMALCAAWIAWHHRKVEMAKRQTIINCEKALGVIDLVAKPANSPGPKGRTAKFIMGIHIVLFVLAIVYMWAM